MKPNELEMSVKQCKTFLLQLNTDQHLNKTSHSALRTVIKLIDLLDRVDNIDIVLGMKVTGYWDKGEYHKLDRR